MVQWSDVLAKPSFVQAVAPGIFLLWPWNQKNHSEWLTRKLRLISGAKSLMNDMWFR